MTSNGLSPIKLFLEVSFTFSKASWKTAGVLPCNFDGGDDKILLIVYFHTLLVLFVSFIVTFLKPEYKLIKVFGGASLMLFMVQPGLSYGVLAPVSGRTFWRTRHIYPTIQEKEFISEIYRYVEWFAIVNPPGTTAEKMGQLGHKK
eukprot:scaffold1168_cov167-Amphora_coffeaeformis.AAC.38